MRKNKDIIHINARIRLQEGSTDMPTSLIVTLLIANYIKPSYLDPLSHGGPDAWADIFTWQRSTPSAQPGNLQAAVKFKSLQINGSKISKMSASENWKRFERWVSTADGFNSKWKCQLCVQIKGTYLLSLILRKDTRGHNQPTISNYRMTT